MTLILELIGLVIALGILFLLLRNFRRQRDYEAGPGKVPEDYE